jgi:hypothetical protein
MARSAAQPKRPDEMTAQRREHLPPVDRRNAEWYPRLGYKTSEAVADLVDNSIDAHARRVHIRIVRTEDAIKRIFIADDGDGMNAQELMDAMQFGGGNAKSNKELGKYGIGLKLASLSQASVVTVLTRQGRWCGGRRWTTTNIAEGWVCEVLDSDEVSGFLSSKFGAADLRKKGTVVVWDQLEHLKASAATVDKTILRTIKELSNELGLKFHRFLAHDALQITIDAQPVQGELNAVTTVVEPLDPFAYPQAGASGYPKKIPIAMPHAGKLVLECHIWPPNSNELGYKLGGGKVSARQGFYFYRNDRLIQAGGWNQCRDDDSEPHLSLARVKVDLPPSMDDAFKLDIKKSSVEPPPSFVPLVLAAAHGSASFKDFTADAYAAYRKKQEERSSATTYVPGKGLSAEVRTTAKRLLSGGAGKPIEALAFAWTELDPDIFVDVDRDSRTMRLNTLYRKKLAVSSGGATGDFAVVKILLFLMLEDEFRRKASSAKSRDWLATANQLLIATINRST